MDHLKSEEVEEDSENWWLRRSEGGGVRNKCRFLRVVERAGNCEVGQDSAAIPAPAGCVLLVGILTMDLAATLTECLQ